MPATIATTDAAKDRARVRVLDNVADAAGLDCARLRAEAKERSVAASIRNLPTTTEKQQVVPCVGATPAQGADEAAKELATRSRRWTTPGCGPRPTNGKTPR